MEIKAKRSSVGDYGSVSRGQILTFKQGNEAEAKKLLATGLYVEYDREAEERAASERAEQAMADAGVATLIAPTGVSIVSFQEEIDRLTLENFDLVEQHGTKDTAINDLREQLERQAEELTVIPMLNDDLAKARLAIVEHEKQAIELREKIAELSKPPAEKETDPANKAGGKKADK